jgi:hypothetical protein
VVCPACKGAKQSSQWHCDCGVPWHICVTHMGPGQACRAKPRCPRGQMCKRNARQVKRQQAANVVPQCEAPYPEEMDTTQTYFDKYDTRRRERADDGNGSTGNATVDTSIGEAQQEDTIGRLRRLEEHEPGRGDDKKIKKAQRRADREDKRNAKRIRSQKVQDAKGSQATVIELSDEEPCLDTPADLHPQPPDDHNSDNPFDFEEGSMWASLALQDMGVKKRKNVVDAPLPNAKRLRSPPSHRHENMSISRGASGSARVESARTEEAEQNWSSEPAAWPQVFREPNVAAECARGHVGPIATGFRSQRLSRAPLCGPPLASQAREALAGSR